MNMNDESGVAGLLLQDFRHHRSPSISLGVVSDAVARGELWDGFLNLAHLVEYKYWTRRSTRRILRTLLNPAMPHIRRKVAYAVLTRRLGLDSKPAK
jgi:hypothetical protein